MIKNIVLFVKDLLKRIKKFISVNKDNLNVILMVVIKYTISKKIIINILMLNIIYLSKIFLNLIYNSQRISLIS